MCIYLQAVDVAGREVLRELSFQDGEWRTGRGGADCWCFALDLAHGLR